MTNKISLEQEERDKTNQDIIRLLKSYNITKEDYNHQLLLAKNKTSFIDCFFMGKKEAIYTTARKYPETYDLAKLIASERLDIFGNIKWSLISFYPNII